MNLITISNKCLRFFSLIRPIRLKQWLLANLISLLFHLLRLRSWFSQIRLSLMLVSGIEAHSGKKMKVLFFSNNNFPVYFRDLMFSEKPEIERKGKIFIWNIKKIKSKISKEVDVVLVSCDQFFQRFLFENDFFVLPHLVDIVLDTSKDLDELLKELPHSASEDVKKVNKQQFSFEICNDEKKLHHFYYDMYKPTLNKRIGETDVFVPDFVFLHYLWEIGYELMMISYKGKEVCGVFFKQNNNEIILKYAGVLDGKNELVRKGAFSAFYYFFMIYAKEKKVVRVNFEGVRPFFNDGLYRYKIKWGSNVEPHLLLPELFGIKILNQEKESLKHFLMNNPFIGIDQKENFVGFVFVDKESDLKERKKVLEKKLLVPGIRKLCFIEI